MEELQNDLFRHVATLSTSIKIIGEPLGNNSKEQRNDEELDEIDGNIYETFTLEEIRCLILAYREKDKDFLLARVTTPDPENGNLFYHFYYSAAEINRVLFRIEANRRLLHRMKVKNPLNNMLISGQILYYKIPMEKIDQTITNYFYSYEDRDVHSEKLQISSDTLTAHPDASSKVHQSTQSFRKYYEEKTINDLEKDIKTIKSVMKKKNKQKLVYKASFFATDDDFLVCSDIREYFKKNALDPNDEFLYEIDRTQNDFLALLEDVSDSEDDEINDWRRIFSAHISLGTTMLIMCLLIGGGPIIALIIFPIALLIMLSFCFSLGYVLCCRRNTFDTLAVETISDTQSMYNENR